MFSCLRIILLTGSDATVSEKAAQLCTACDLPSPNLFVMPYVDRPEGYVNRYNYYQCQRVSY